MSPGIAVENLLQVRINDFVLIVHRDTRYSAIPVAFISIKNRVPYAVGRMLMSFDTLGPNTKGKAVLILHVYHDQLW